MNEQFYKRAKELLYQSSYITNSFSSNANNLYQSSDFHHFFRALLQRYIDACDVFGLIATTFVPNSSEGHYKTFELMRKLQQVTGERRCCQNLKYFLDMEQEVKKLREDIRKINESIAQLKYYQFPFKSEKYQLILPEKIKRIVNALNVYESYIISVSAQQSLNKLEGEELEAYRYYQKNVYNYTTDMVSALASISTYKEDWLALKEQFRKNIPLDQKDPQQALQFKNIQYILKQLWNCKKEFEEVPRLLDKMIPSIEQRKEIPSKYTLAPQINNRAIIDSYNSLCQAIRKSYSQSSSSTLNPSSSGYKIIYKGQSSPQRVVVESFTPQYLDFIDFVEKLYSKVEQSAVKIPYFEKMDRIERAFSNQNSYSVNIIEEVTSFSDTLNPFIFDCLKFFNVRKDQTIYSNLAFEFSLRDLEALNKAIKDRMHQEPNRLEQNVLVEQYEQLKRIAEQKEEDIKQLTTFKDRVTQTFFNLACKFDIYPPQKELESQLSEQIEALCNTIIKQCDGLKDKKIKNEANSGQYQLLVPQQLENDQKQVKSIPMQNQQKLLADLQASQLCLREKEKLIINEYQKNREAIQNIRELQAQIKGLKQQIQKKEVKIAGLISAGNEQQEINYQTNLQKARQQIQQEIEKYKSQLSMLKSDNQSIHMQKIILKNQLQELIHLKQEEQSSLKRTYEEEINQLRRSNAKNIQQIQILTQQLTKIQQLNDHLKQQNQILKKNAEDLNQRFTQRITEDLNRTINQISKASMILQSKDILHQLEEDEPELQKSIHQSITSKKQVQTLLDDYKKQSGQLISQLKKTEMNLQGEVAALKDQVATKTKEIEDSKRQNTALINHIQSQRKEFEAMLLERNQDQGRLVKLQNIIEKLKSQRSQSIQYKQNFYRSPVKISGLPAMIPYTNLLFNDEIFLNDPSSKERLMYHLESYASTRIKATNLVYKFDPRNKSNFHLYLDEVKNLILVIKTDFAIIAGFYPGVYKDKQLMDKGGLLVSVTNNESYQLRKPNKDQKITYKGMIYDSYFVIYGNAEIRVRIGYKTVFSNFGVNNSYFDPRGHKIDAFLNQGDKRQVEFLGYEFYEVIFEDELPFRETI